MKSLVKRLVCLVILAAIVFSASIAMPIDVNASNSIQSKLDTFMVNYPSGSRWTSSFDGGIQCYGFAKLVIYNLFGTSNGSYRTWRYDGTPTVGMKVIGSVTNYSSSNVKSLLSNATSGDVLQFDTSKQHSMIVYKVDSDGVWIYDCNWDSNCGINLRKSSFGAWSGRNSSKLTLLRADNYDTHTVDSSYGTSFTAYPKEKITASNILDAYHNQISSTAWIGTSDLCTIHEVYTDGCCKASYPLDSGGSQTVYCKVSLFNITHTCNYSTYVYYEAAHPHYNCYKCSICGIVNRKTAETNQIKTCSSCWYAKFDVSASSISLKVGESKTISATINGFWPDTMEGVFDYDSSGIEVTTSQNAITFKGLKVGNYTLKLIIYSDGTKSHVIGSKSVSVAVAKSTYSVSYNPNGGTGVPSAQTKTYNQPLILSSTKPTRTGYTFLGWATSSTATSVKYQAGETYTVNADAKLYAVWQPNTLTVYYNANGAKINSSTFGISGNVVYTLSDGEKLKHIWTYNNKLEDGLYNASTFGLAKTGYTFKGWGTTSSGGVLFDQDDANLAPTDINTNIISGNCSTMLYAIWTPNTYAISFNANGGVGAPEDQTKTHGQILVLSSTIPERNGYTFIGWSTSKTAAIAEYNVGDDFDKDNSTVLYAVWKKNVDIVTVPDTTESVVHPTEVTTESVVVTEPIEATTESVVVTEPTETTTESTLIATEPTEITVTDPIETESTELSTGAEDKSTESTEPSTPDETKPTEPSEDKGVLGDVNGDGKVNVKDATLIQKAAAKIIKLTDDESLRADVNGDSKVNIKDATAIQKFAAKIETGFTIGKPIGG